MMAIPQTIATCQSPLWRPGEDGSVHGPASEEDQEIRSQALRQGLLEQRGLFVIHEDSFWILTWTVAHEQPR